jgi:predicted RNA methylase
MELIVNDENTTTTFNDEQEKEEFMSKLVDNYEILRYYLQTAETFDPKHYGFLPICYKIMETDKQRIQSFVQAFKKYNMFKDAIVCEVGIGRLALTKFYLDHCRKAYLIESNPHICDFIKNELKKNKWEQKVTLIFDDALRIELPEKVDYIIGELMSIYCANEFQVPIFRHMRQWLNTHHGRLLPSKIKNLIQVGYTIFNDKHKYYSLMFTRHWPCLMTNQVLVNVIDLYVIEEMEVKCQIIVKALLTGQVNCVLLNSFIEVARGCNFTGTDSLMPPTVVKLINENIFEIEEDKEYLLKIQFTYATSLDQAIFEISKLENNSSHIA